MYLLGEAAVVVSAVLSVFCAGSLVTDSHVFRGGKAELVMSDRQAFICFLVFAFSLFCAIGGAKFYGWI